MLKNLESKISRFVKYTTLASGMWIASIMPSLAQQLTVHAYNQEGNPVSGAQVVLNTKHGTIKNITDDNGISIFSNINDTVEVSIAKDNYISATHKIPVNSDTEFTGALLDRVQTRTGTNNTGTDTASIHPNEFKGVFGVDEIIEKNPKLFDVQSTWPNYNVPVYIDMTTGIMSVTLCKK
jgi:hypothetical protein